MKGQSERTNRAAVEDTEAGQAGWRRGTCSIEDVQRERTAWTRACIFGSFPSYPAHVSGIGSLHAMKPNRVAASACAAHCMSVTDDCTDWSTSVTGECPNQRDEREEGEAAPAHGGQSRAIRIEGLCVS